MPQGKIVELVIAWDEFENIYPDGTVEDFCRYYLVRNSNAANINSEAHAGGTSNGAMLGQLIGRLGDLGVFYLKKSIAESPINNFQDFIYLGTLLQMGTPTKSDLIGQMLSEFTSGMSIINRLIKKGYVVEFPDEDDHRSKRIRITDEGRDVILKSFAKADKAAEVFTHNIDENELAFILKSLSKLNEKHTFIHKTMKNKSLDQIYEQVVQNSRFEK